MKLLLDTNVLLWVLEGNPRLDPYRAVLDPAHQVFFSPVSVAEISIKSSLGKLAVQPGYVETLVSTGFAELPLTGAHAEALAALPWRHRDPFDRLLISQALAEGLTVATSDAAFAQYGVPLLAPSAAEP